MLRQLAASVGHLHAVPMETQLHRNKLSGRWWSSAVGAFMKTESNYNTPQPEPLRALCAEVLSQRAAEEGVLERGAIAELRFRSGLIKHLVVSISAVGGRMTEHLFISSVENLGHVMQIELFRSPACQT